ncbi:hypothetical protein H6F43_03165 [Leptolyngbya sp. FACHB-36]|nr:hypothetical protein [Leptolyngbya sp. FACHB-36]
MAKFSDVTKRTTITLPKEVFESLEEWADGEGRPTANLAAFLVEVAVRIKYPDRFPPKIKSGEPQ